MFITGYDPTIEDSYTKWVTVGGKANGTRVFLEVTDTAGQEAFVAIRDHYITNGDGFLLVYAINDEQSFKQLDSIRDHIQRIKQSKDVPIMIAANKIDLASDRQVDAEKGLSFAEEQLGDKTAYMETSAKDDTNVDNVFSALVERTYRYLNGSLPAEEKTLCCSLM